MSSSVNPMQRNDISVFQWKETQTEEDLLLGEEKSKYNSTHIESEYTDIARQKEELAAERRRFAAQQHQMQQDLAEAEKQRAGANMNLTRQKDELAAERRKIADERKQMLQDLEEAERKRKAAEKALEEVVLDMLTYNVFHCCNNTYFKILLG